MGDYCPFLSTSLTNPVDLATDGIECIEGDCKLWDSTRNCCSFESGQMALAHWHISHLHGTSHSCGTEANPNLSVGCGANSAVATSPPYASALAMEFVANQDMDGVGLAALQGLNPNITSSIYGYGFQIAQSDDDIPLMIKSLYENDSFTKDAPEITWNQYLSVL